MCKEKRKCQNFNSPIKKIYVVKWCTVELCWHDCELRNCYSQKFHSRAVQLEKTNIQLYV